MKLITLAKLKTLLPQPGTAHDALLTLLIEGYSLKVEQHLNRKLKKEARTQGFRGGSRAYWLPAYPIDSGEDFIVVEDGVTLTEDDDYFVDYTSGMVEFASRTTTRTPKPVVFTWTGGFVEEAVDVGEGQTETVIRVPESVELATYLQVNYVYRRRDKLGLDTVNLGNNLGSVGLQGLTGLVAEVRNLLHPERRFPSQL